MSVIFPTSELRAEGIETLVANLQKGINMQLFLSYKYCLTCVLGEVRRCLCLRRKGSLSGWRWRGEGMGFVALGPHPRMEHKAGLGMVKARPWEQGGLGRRMFDPRLMIRAQPCGL